MGCPRAAGREAKGTVPSPKPTQHPPYHAGLEKTGIPFREASGQLCLARAGTGARCSLASSSSLPPPPRDLSRQKLGVGGSCFLQTFFFLLRGASTRSSVALRLLICLVGGEQHRTGKRQRSDAQLDVPIWGGGVCEERLSGSSVKIDAPSCCCARTPGLITPHPPPSC